MEDGKNGSVTNRIQKLVRMPARGQRAGFRFTITHNATREQIRIVKHSAVSVGKGVAQFSAFVDGAGCLGCDVAGNTPWKRELSEKSLQALFVLGNMCVELAIGALEIGVGHDPGTTMARACYVHRIEVVLLDDSVEMDVDKIQPWSSAPVPQQPELDVLQLQRFA